MKPARLCLVALAFSLASASTFADTRSFRCKQDLVKLGDSKSTALSKCGEPVMKDSFCKKDQQAVAPAATSSSNRGTTVIVNNGCDTVDEWTYNPGVGQFMTTLQFEQGTLKAIKYGARVR